jgi:hypothetical protein
MQADAGTEAGLASEEFDNTRCREFFLGAKQSAQQELIGLRVERGETEKGMLYGGHFGRSR